MQIQLPSDVETLSPEEVIAFLLEQFPGKKAFINETIERLRSNLKAFIVEMNRMSEEHNKGDIDVLIPADQFEGAYRTMARGINEMVAGHISVKKKAMACVGEFSKGNFDAALQMNERMRARPWLALTQADYADMLLTRDGPGDRSRASALRDEAADTYRELGMLRHLRHETV